MTVKIHPCVRTVPIFNFLMVLFSVAPWVFPGEPLVPVTHSNSEKRLGCPGVPGGFCIFPFEDIAMVLYDCESGSMGGFPPTHLNIPAGQDFRFSILRPVDSGFATFAIVSEAVANGQGADPCVGGPGVFVGPIAIEPIGTPTPTIYEIPSAVVDQMIAQVNLDGFVVMLAMGCPGAQLFSGLDFTRNPPDDATDLSLELNSGPETVFIEEDFDLILEVTNNGDNDAINPEITLNLPLGTTLVSGNVGGQACQVNGSQVNCPTNDLGPAQSVTGNFTFNAGLGGKVVLDLHLLSETCDSNAVNNQLQVAPLATCDPNDPCFFGLGQDGGGIQSEIWVYNPMVDSAATVNIFATDPNCVASGEPFDGSGLLNQVIPPGETRSFTSVNTDPDPDLYLFWARASSEELVIEIRQTREVLEPELFSFGTTASMIRQNEIANFDDDYPIPFFDILDGTDQNIIVFNLTSVPQTTTGFVRNNNTGNASAQFSTTVKPYEIQTFPLDMLGLPGTDPHGFWKSGGNGVVAGMEIDKPGAFQYILPFYLINGVTPDLAQPIYQPDPASMEYDPSELEMYVADPAGNATPDGAITFEFDTTCEPEESMERFSFLFGNPSNTPIFLPIDIDDQLGGFGTPLPPQTFSTVRWKEGDSEIWIQAKNPVENWIVHIPPNKPVGDPTGTPARVMYQIRSEADTKLPVAAFGNEGDLIRFNFLDVPEGSHLYCLDDLTLDDELDFLEFQVPPGQPGDVWFNAIADEPDLEYKDELPLHKPGNSRVGEFTRVLEAWNGNGGTSCLGDAPDILDIVNFMNNGLKCP